MPCRVCGQDSRYVFTTKVMKKHDVKYYVCDQCEFMQVEEPYWLDEAYASPINLTDTGIISRNLNYSVFVSVIISLLLDSQAKYLDYAGGYGIFTRLMRDLGYDFYWQDIYTTNLVARGFEYQPDMGELKALTAFETFEHFVTPMPEMEKMLEMSDTIIFSTNMRPELVPDPEEWWYYGREHGQHTALYTVNTLKFIAQKFGLTLYTNGGDFHMFSKEKLLPKVLEIGVFNRLLQSTTNKKLLQEAYKSKPISLKKVKHVLANKYRERLYGKYVWLQEKLGSAKQEELQSLFNSDSLSQAFISLLVQANYLQKSFVLPTLQSKTFSDMLHMKQFMHVD